jgi:hypothetical protein
VKRFLTTSSIAAVLLGTLLTGPAQGAMHGDNYGPFATLNACQSFQRQLVQVGGYRISNPCHKHVDGLTTRWYLYASA